MSDVPRTPESMVDEAPKVFQFSHSVIILAFNFFVILITSLLEFLENSYGVFNFQNPKIND